MVLLLAEWEDGEQERFLSARRAPRTRRGELGASARRLGVSTVPMRYSQTHVQVHGSGRDRVHGEIPQMERKNYPRHFRLVSSEFPLNSYITFQIMVQVIQLFRLKTVDMMPAVICISIDNSLGH